MCVCVCVFVCAQVEERPRVGVEGEVGAIDGDVTLVEGERFIVAGSGSFAWSCGFTQAYDPAVAADWAGVFEG